METSRGAAENFNSQNLRDFLRIKEEEHHNILSHRTAVNTGMGRHSHSGLTLSALLSDKRRPGLPDNEPLPRVQSNRTLLDIIRDDQTQHSGDGRKSWRHFKENLRLCRSAGGSSWTSTVPVPVPASDISINNNWMMLRRPPTGITESTQPNISASPSFQMNSNRATERASGRFEHTSSLAMRRLRREDNGNHNEEDEEGGVVAMEEEAEGEQQPVRISLMSLLAETDRQMGLDGSTFTLDEEEGEDKEEEEEEEESGGGNHNNCCVCMVRHKGAAFIPCGHTFCRLCSREVLAQRGNCPLCNNYIVEILDIF